MAKGLSFFANSSAPSLTIIIKRSNVPIDLTGASVAFQMLLSGTTTLAVNYSCVIIAPPVNGTVRYDWQPGDLKTVGNYLANCLITYANGTQEPTETTTLQVLDTIPPTVAPISPPIS